MNAAPQLISVFSWSTSKLFQESQLCSPECMFPLSIFLESLEIPGLLMTLSYFLCFYGFWKETVFCFFNIFFLIYCGMQSKRNAAIYAPSVSWSHLLALCAIFIYVCVRDRHFGNSETNTSRTQINREQAQDLDHKSCLHERS